MTAGGYVFYVCAWTLIGLLTIGVIGVAWVWIKMLCGRS